MTEVGEAFTIGETISLDPRDIDIREGDRLRAVDTRWAEAIGASMQRDGQINPVHVCRNSDGGWELAGPGGHRVTGARIVGIAVDAKIVSCDRNGQRRREAAENLFRRANDPVERAKAVAELVQAHRAKAGLSEAERRENSVPQRLKKQISDEADATLETISNVYGWTDEIGEQLGLSGRTLRNDLLIYRGIGGGLVQRLRDQRHPILTNASQLRALAKLDEVDQVRVVDQLRPPRKTVGFSTSLNETSQSVPAIRPPFGLTLEFGNLFGDEVLAYRALLGEFEGRANKVRVPLFDLWFAAKDWQLNAGGSTHSDGTTFSDGARYMVDDLSGVLVTGAQGDRIITADFGGYDAAIRPALIQGGLFFGLGEHPYLATRVFWDGPIATIRASSTLRAAYIDERLKLRPTMVAGLPDDDTGQLMLEKARYGAPTLDLVERFDGPFS